jgi:hypothetical protein
VHGSGAIRLFSKRRTLHTQKSLSIGRGKSEISPELCRIGVYRVIPFFVAHLKGNLSHTYHLVIWSWSRNLKLKFPDPRVGCGAVPISKNHISGTMTKFFPEVVFSGRTPQGHPKMSTEQSCTTPLSGPKPIFRGPERFRGPPRVNRGSTAAPCTMLS